MTTRPDRAARGAAVLALVAGAVAGCAGAPGAEETTAMPDPTSAAPSDRPRPTSVPDDAPGPASPVPTTSAPPVEDLPVPTPSATSVTVSGTVAAGVEAGCLVLTSGGTTYLLLGSHELLAPGADVTVDGTLVTDVLTTCQQGTPLQVRDVRSR